MAKIEKSRFWVSIGYPEDFPPDWREDIGDKLQLPYAYCIHDKDVGKDGTLRPPHFHLIVVFPNTTTYNHALNVFNLLSPTEKPVFRVVEACNIRHMYDYLIHDTDDSRKKGKFLYDPSERITGNNFDIGAYEQIDLARKNEIFRELSDAIKDNGICNYMDFYEYISEAFVDELTVYLEIMRSYSGHFERLTKANFQKAQQGRITPYGFPDMQKQEHEQQYEEHEEHEEICCPNCGNLDLKKKGKTQAGSQRMGCKACGKIFTI